MFSPIQELCIPTSIYFGKDSISKLSIPPGKVLFVKSPSLPSFIDLQFQSLFKNYSGSVLTILKPPGEPSSDQIDSFYLSLNSFDYVLSVGGGSTLDFAKALALLGGSGGSITDYEYGSREIDMVKPLYLVPTTCGTGSEVTPYTVINNFLSKRKFTLTSHKFLARQAAIDPEFLSGLSYSVILSTALDAFTHCLESILTKCHVDLIQPLAIEGIHLAFDTISNLSPTDTNCEYFPELSRLSLLGGISIAHSRTGLIHTLSVSFAQHIELPHGILNCLLLRFALSHSLHHYNGLLKEILNLSFSKDFSSDTDAFEFLVQWIDSVLDIKPDILVPVVQMHKASLLTRILQDKGLQTVCHGTINEHSILSLLNLIENA